MVESSTMTAKGKAAARVWEAASKLRICEKLALVYLTYLPVAATFFRLSLTQGFTMTALNFLTGGVITLLSRFNAEKSRARLFSPAGAAQRGGSEIAGKSEFLATVRDWFPAILILVAYRESGLLLLPDASHRLDYLFVRWDHALLRSRWVLGVVDYGSPWVQRYLEFSYSLCYPLVPLGLGALYVLREWPRLAPRTGFDAERAIDQFWTTVLGALFTCYALFPLFPSTPPRTLFHDLPGPAVQPLFRHINLWILGQYGIESSVFPSGHVAAVTAVALSVRAHWPRAGVFFAIAAVSVAVATVVGRYHYAADALAGALIGIAAFLVSSRIHRS